MLKVYAIVQLPVFAMEEGIEGNTNLNVMLTNLSHNLHHDEEALFWIFSLFSF